MFYTSSSTLSHRRYIHAIRSSKTIIILAKYLKERYSYCYVGTAPMATIDYIKSSTGIVRWKDTKLVTPISSDDGGEPMCTVRRYD